MSRRRIVILATFCLAFLAGCALFDRTAAPAEQPGQRTALRFHVASAWPQEAYAELKDEAGQPLYIAAEPFLTGRDVQAATVLLGQSRNLVRLAFTPMAAGVLEATTRQHVGQRLAIFLDDCLIMSPHIREPITSGEVILDGGFARRAAEDIAAGLGGPQEVSVGTRP